MTEFNLSEQDNNIIDLVVEGLNRYGSYQRLPMNTNNDSVSKGMYDDLKSKGLIPIVKKRLNKLTQSGDSKNE